MVLGLASLNGEFIYPFFYSPQDHMDSSTPPPAHMDFSHHHLLLCKEICCLFLFGTTFCRFISELHGFCGAEVEASSDRSDAIRILSAPLPPCLLQHRRSGPFNRPSDARTKSGDGEEATMRANRAHTPYTQLTTVQIVVSK